MTTTLLAPNAFGESANANAALGSLVKTNKAHAFCLATTEDRLATINQVVLELAITIDSKEMELLAQDQISDDFLYEVFEFETNHIDNNASLEGNMFETYGSELAYVQKVYAETPNRVWTYTDNGDSVTFVNGMHLVNRLGYLVAKSDTPVPSALVFVSEDFGSELDD